jgi:hypothetical protein
MTDDESLKTTAVDDEQRNEAGEEPASVRIMWEIGVEGDRFNKHRESEYCKTAGCVPV